MEHEEKKLAEVLTLESFDASGMIRKLEQVLADAKAGKIIGVTIFSMQADRSLSRQRDYLNCFRPHFITLLELEKHTLLHLLDEQTERHEPK